MDVLFEQKGEAGIITLNRPQALNALNREMVHLINNALDKIESTAHITRVILKGAGGKAFCAGGDIRALYELGKAGKQAEALTFWRDEYLLNIRLKEFKKPIIALIDGIVMGGGVGLSAPCSYIVAGEKYVFAMPEVSIGFFPDVGGSYYLSRIPSELGTYAALTGERFKQGDAFATGLATHVVRSAIDLEEQLYEGDIETTLEANEIPTSSGLPKGSIKRIFAENSLDKIFANLERDVNLAKDDFASKTLAIMQKKSPLSMKLALEQVRLGAKMTFQQVMTMEFRIVSRIVYAADFYEGVRAAIIDKDGAPKWSSPSNDIASYFAPLPNGELL